MRVFAFVILSVLIFTSCSRYEELPEYGTTAPTPTPIQRPPEKIDPELQRVIAEISKSAQAKVGVGALLLETGDAAYLDRHGRFAMQSVYKLPIAMAVAKMIDDNKVRIDADVNISPDDFVRRGYHSPIRNMNPQGTVMPLVELLRYSLSESDGTANDVLLDLAGGPAEVQGYLTSIGISDMVVADSTKTISYDWDAQYRNYATPDASVRLMTAIFDERAGLSDLTTGIILNAMTQSDTGRRRIKRGLPEGAVLAHKTGTGGRPSEVPGYTALNANANSNKGAKNSNTSTSSKRRATPSPSPSPQKKKSVRRNKDRSANSNADEFGGEIRDQKSHEITSATNDVGIITLPDGRHIILAVYIQDSTADGPTREKVIADIARAVCERWTIGTLPDVNILRR